MFWRNGQALGSGVPATPAPKRKPRKAVHKEPKPAAVYGGYLKDVDASASPQAFDVLVGDLAAAQQKDDQTGD